MLTLGSSVLMSARECERKELAACLGFYFRVALSPTSNFPLGLGLNSGFPRSKLGAVLGKFRGISL